jgi:hypothetical protein
MAGHDRSSITHNSGLLCRSTHKNTWRFDAAVVAPIRLSAGVNGTIRAHRASI